jgi:phage-related protein
MKTTADDVVQQSIATSVSELENARTAVQDLANELASVIDVIEPALADQVGRLRASRMASVGELQQIASAVREVRLMLLSKDAGLAIERGEKLLTILRDLEDFRASGALDAFAKAFATVSA